MLFVATDGHTEVVVGSRRRRSRPERTPAEKRRLRDLAMLLLQRSGYSLSQIAEVAESFHDDPIRARPHIQRRIKLAEQAAARPAAG